MVAERGWQHRLHLGEDVARGGAELGIAPALHHARAEHQRFDLLFVEHEWRQVVAARQRVSDAGFAQHRHPGEDEIAHVPVDGPLRDAQVVRQRAGGGHPSPAETLDDSEQPIGAAHLGEG